MSATTSSPSTSSPASTTDQVPAAGSRPAPRERATGLRPLSTWALMRVELVKMFDTRSGFWLLASIGILSVIASAAVIAFGSEESITFDTFASSIGVPIAILLPVVAVLSVTSEWSQRTGLTTFALIPHRSRVIGAKLGVSVVVGVVAMVVALTVGALGNLLGAAVHGIDPVWGVSAGNLALVVLANILGMGMGFMFGTVLRNSPAAIVAYFVYSMVLPQLFGTLAYFQSWFEDVWGWVDFFYASTFLYEGSMTAERWGGLAVSGLIWLVLPLAWGLRRVVRAEVK